MTAKAERVALGAAFLDEHDPPWWRVDVENAIDLDLLDLSHDGRCPLGQRCPLEMLAAYHGTDEDARVVRERDSAYFAYARQLLYPVRVLRDWALAHGFAAEMTGEYRELTAEWARAIAGRRAAA